MNKKLPLSFDKSLLSYVIGIALGDGNLSNPNGRATRLRVTCDLKYPKLINKIQRSIATLLPNNKVSIVTRQGNYVDISCYSNFWESALGWRVGKGSKIVQKVSVPNWVKKNTEFKINCLRGLIETDGSIYKDRGYKMMMFVNAARKLAYDVYEIIKSLKFEPHIYKVKNGRKSLVYRIRLSKDVERFLELIQPEKF
ncbi:LAGLIDADG family homing endonuclease [Patescibacteria group bacterium]|nr:LAGLIDADG family homing endonuclease [Patescibacteria group bacterium]